MPTILERYTAAKQAATELHNKVRSEDRPMTDKERGDFNALIDEATGLKAQHERAVADQSALADLNDLADLAERPTETSSPAARGSWGDRFVDSAEYKRMLNSYGGNVPSGTRVSMGSVSMGDIRNALISDPGFTNPDIEVVRTNPYTNNLFDAISIVPNSPQSFKTFTATFTNAAATVAEGAAKPESSLSWDPVTVTLETTAHWVPVTNQALSHESLVRDEIDTNLVNGVRAKLAGDVATVVAAAAGVQTQAYDTDLTTTIRKAITKAQTAAVTLGTGPIGILVSATDAETIDLEQLAYAAYAAGQAPQQVAGLWRTPLVVVPGFTAGYAYVGDLKQIKLHTGPGGVKVTTGWQGTQFIENKLTVLAETEAKARVRLAGALVKADLTAA